MATMSPTGAPADLNKPRRGRPPLLAKSACNLVSIDRFLQPGAASSASSSACSASSMAGQGLGTSENQNPNVVHCSNTSPTVNRNLNLGQMCGPMSENRPTELKKASKGRPRKTLSPVSTEASFPNMVPTSPGPNSKINPNPNPSPSPSPNISPKPNDAHGFNPNIGHMHQSDSENTPVTAPAPKQENAPGFKAVSKDAANVVAKKGVKRKRTILTGPLDAETKDSLVKELRSEVSSLFKFYHEDGKIDLTMAGGNNAGRRVEVALLIEESSLPFSSLVANLLLQLRATDDGDLTPASMRSTVLSIGERMSFGTSNPDADVLEDDSDACLWCWEVRDMKLLPEANRSLIAGRRRKRRKISERIAALLGIITALTSTHDKDQELPMLKKAEEALLKTESEDLIRAHFNQWRENTTAKGAVREKKMREKETLKEQQRLAREAEKEQKRLEKEEEKEKKRMEKEEEKKKLLQEKEKERLEKEKERLEREASKQKLKEALQHEKELKRQQEEIEKEQRRKEKEEADLKRQSALKKQANLMDRFLQSKKDQADSVSCLPDHMGIETQACNGSPLHEKVIHEMDEEMRHCADMSVLHLLSSHVKSWKKHSLLSSRRNLKRWGQRRVPKMTPVNELRLQGGLNNAFEGAYDSQAGLGASAGGGCKRSRAEFEESELNSEKSEPEWDDSGVMDFSALVEQDVAADPQKSSHLQNKRRKLLQFDKSHRPAYYGSFSKQSEAVRPRNPLKMDSNLDYENDSDEEWEEEDPGESLSDCEKDEEDEKPDPDEDEEAGDGFVVPDGYLSESEVAHVDESESESDAEHSHDPTTNVAVGRAMQPDGSQNLLKFARQRKVLEQLTDQALRRNRPYIICNFHQSKSANIAQKTERDCLDALKVCPLFNEIQIEVPQDPQLLEQVDDDKKKSIKRRAKGLPPTALREMVEVLLSSTHGLKRLVDLLSTKFPEASRSQLRDKIKEIADFVDNHWQVKKEIVEQLGITLPCPQAANNPEPVTKNPSIQLKPITKFFSKRCLPPETAGLEDISPLKGKEKYCSKNNVGAGENILKGEANSMPSVERNSIQSI
eukprot:c24053_g2_i1 orf=288-3503(+)